MLFSTRSFSCAINTYSQNKNFMRQKQNFLSIHFLSCFFYPRNFLILERTPALSLYTFFYKKPTCSIFKKLRNFNYCTVVMTILNKKLFRFFGSNKLFRTVKHFLYEVIITLSPNINFEQVVFENSTKLGQIRDQNRLKINLKTRTTLDFMYRNYKKKERKGMKLLELGPSPGFL